MEKITPWFEVNGQRYEIKKTRYLIAEYDKATKEKHLDSEQQENVVKLQRLMEDVRKLAEKLQQLEETYFETFDDEDERKYLKCKELYDATVDRVTHLEASTNCTTIAINTAAKIHERIAILGLAEQYFNFNENLARETWEMYVDSLPSHNVAIEWLSLMADSLFNEDEEEHQGDDFFSQKRMEAQRRAENRRNLTKKKK